MSQWVVTGHSPLPPPPAVQVPAVATVTQWQPVGETPVDAVVQAKLNAAAHPIESGKDAFIDSTLKAIAVPGKPEWNLDALGTNLQAMLPSWLGGESKAQQEQQEAADLAAHPYISGAGSLTGHGLEAAGAGALTGGIADAALPGAGLATTLGRSALTNAAAGAAGTPDHPLAGALAGAGLGIAGTAAAAGGRKLVGALNTVRNPQLATDMTSVGLTPTNYAVGSPMISKLTNALAGAKDAVTSFSQKDLVKAALKPFGITDTTDLTNSTIGRAENATWDATNQLMKNTTVGPTPTLSQTLDNIVSTYKSKVATNDFDSAVVNDAADIVKKVTNGKWNGQDALSFYRSIRNRGYGASDPFTKQAFSDIANTLKHAIGEANPDALTSLKQSDLLHQKLLVLKDVAEKANKNPNGLPTLAQFAQSNQTLTPYGSVEGPYQPLVNAAQSAYTAPAGSTARYANPIAAMLSKGLPMAAGAAAEHVVGPLGWLLGPAIEKTGEHGLATALRNVALRQAGQAVAAPATSVSRQALQNALLGLAANGTTKAVN